MRLGLAQDVIGPIPAGEEPPAGWWAVAAGYTVAWLVSLPLWSRLSDVYGRRRLWLAAMLLFLAGAAGSLTSQELIQLTVSRFAQGLGVGAVFALGPALIGDLYSTPERVKRQSVLVAAFGSGLIGWPFTLPVAVPLIVISGLDVDYFFVRWSLVLNLPVGALLLLAAWFGLPAQRLGIRRRIDVAGGLAFVGTVAPLLLVFLLAGGPFPWLSAPTVALLGVATAMLAILVIVGRRSSDSIIDPRILTHRIYVVAAIALLIVNIGLIAVTEHGGYFFQQIDGSRFAGTGTWLSQSASLTLAFVVGALFTGQIMARTGRHKMLILVLALIAAVGAVLLSRMGGRVTAIDVLRNLAIIGLGLGGLFTALIVVVQNATPRRNLGEVTAGTLFVGFLGLIVGYPRLPRLAVAWYGENVPAESTQLESDPTIALETSLEDLAGGSNAASDLGPEILTNSMFLTNSLLDARFLLVAILLAVAFVLVTLLPKMPPHTETDTDSDNASVTALANGNSQVPDTQARTHQP